MGPTHQCLVSHITYVTQSRSSSGRKGRMDGEGGGSGSETEKEEVQEREVNRRRAKAKQVRI